MGQVKIYGYSEDAHALDLIPEKLLTTIGSQEAFIYDIGRKGCDSCRGQEQRYIQLLTFVGPHRGRLLSLVPVSSYPFFCIREIGSRSRCQRIPGYEDLLFSPES